VVRGTTPVRGEGGRVDGARKGRSARWVRVGAFV